MTLVTRGNEEIIEQITKQLNKLVEVVKLLDLSEGSHIEREMMLVKIKAESPNREELKRLVDIFRGNIIDVTDTSYIVEMTGDSDKLDAFVKAVHEDLVVEVVRTGPSGIARGAKGLTL
jgi:acetolactate synthase-1/3 small subunit